MKRLLVALNAKYIHSNLAVYCLSRYCSKHGLDVAYAEYTTNQLEDEILWDIYRQEPDFLAFSCYIWNIEMVKRLIRNLHELRPELPIWVGGPEVSYDPEQMLQDNPGITGIMCGEGEETLRELLQLYQDRGLNEASKSFYQVKGIAYREGDTVCMMPSRELLPLDEVPFPYDESMDLTNRIMYYETSRGCPFACSYCLSSIDKTVRFRSLPLVYRELDYFLARKVKQVKFVDRTFNCKSSHSRAIWQYIKEHDNGVTNFHFELSADLLKEEDYALVADMRPGLVQFEIGVQTTNPSTLEAIRRTASLRGIEDAVARIKKGGNIHQHLDLIAGLPYEDYESFSHSFDEVYAMKPDQLQLGFLKVLKGSYMEQMQEEYGLITHRTPPYEVLASKWVSYPEMMQLKRVEAMVEIYYNSGQFPMSIPYLIHKEERPFVFFSRLGDYVERRDAVGTSHSRLQRYEILLEYAIEAYGREEEAVYRQLLCYDLYQRENLKNPPSFAIVKDEQQKWIHEFYRDEERVRTILPEYADYQTRQIARMTHVESMTIDVAKSSQCGLPIPWEGYVLFDYLKRDALTYSANVTMIAK